MKTYELKPTDENLITTFLEDSISRDEDILRFIKILDAFDESCSVALDGNWGSGKTFFVNQVKMVLDAYNDFNSIIEDENKTKVKAIITRLNNNRPLEVKPQVCVYYDAWENDNDEDPIMSLMYAILNSVDTDFSFKLEKNCVDKAIAILEFFSGKGFRKLIDNLKSESLLADLKVARNIKEIINEFLDSLLVEKGDRLVIFIDELDRCKPSYAVKLLERIKHYFSKDNITFVFSINISELQHTIKRYYGDDFNAYRYLDRFFDLRISLPKAGLNKYYRSLNFDETSYIYDKVSRAVISAYQFELREIAKYIRLIKIAAYDVTHDNNSWYLDGEGLQFGLCYIIPIIIGLKIYDSNKYTDFISGTDFTPLVNVAHYLRENFFDRLLSSNETFDKSEQEKTYVKIEDKLKEVYNALFNTIYDGRRYNVVVGKYEFNNQTRENVLRTASLLSKFSNFEIN